MKHPALLSIIVTALLAPLLPAQPQVRYHIAVHSEEPGGGSNGIPVTPNFSTTNKATYVRWREAILGFAALCEARGLAWQFEPDYNFLLGVQRFEISGGAAYDSRIALGTLPIPQGGPSTNTGGVNVVKHLHDHFLVNIDPHAHETAGTPGGLTYNFADVAWLIQNVCGVTPTSVVGGHVYTGANYQRWPKFIQDASGLEASQHAGFFWRPVLMMGGGTGNHVNDPHITGLWWPTWNQSSGSTDESTTDYFTDDADRHIAAVGNWEQDFHANDQLLRQLEDGTVPHSNKLWTLGRVFNHRDMVLTGALTSICPAQLDTIRRWRDAGRVTVQKFTDTYAEWTGTPHDGNSTLYQRPVHNAGFSWNWQDFAYVEKSCEELRLLLNHHETVHVPVDVFFTTWQTDLIEQHAPELLGRLQSSSWVCMAYHVRAPKPYANDFDWFADDAEYSRALTAADITNYETHGLNLEEGEPTAASGGYAKLTSLMGYAPVAVGTNGSGTNGSLAQTYFAGAGAQMLVEHREGQAVNFGETKSGMDLRPESYDWRLIELLDGRNPDAPATLGAALDKTNDYANATAPYFLGIKIHDNDLFSEQSSWTYYYEARRNYTQPWQPRPWNPWNPDDADTEARPAELTGTERARRRQVYLDIVSEAADHTAATSGGSTFFNLVSVRDTLSLLGEAQVRPIGLTFTETNEGNTAGGALAEISGGGIESGVACDYALVSGTGDSDNADFTINGSQLLATRCFDYETEGNPVKRLRVRWTDGGGNTGERALTLVVANVITDDDDGDGFTEEQETLAGTNSLDASSLLSVQTMQRNGSEVTLTWASVAGKTYRVQTSADLVLWQDVTGSDVTAGSSTTACSVTILQALDRLFFRVKVITP